MSIINRMITNAKKNQQRIILPESYEPRTLQAANKIVSEKIAQIILIGNKDKILAVADNLKLKYIQYCEFIDPTNHPKKNEYKELLYQIRSSKGLTKEQADKLIEDPLYWSALMIKSGDADGEVAGAENTTGNVLKPALQIIKTRSGISSVSGANIMELPNYLNNTIFVFADCAVNPDPSAEQLAEIAILSAETTEILCNHIPKVAMLSFSTKGSAKHPMVDKVVQATEIAKILAPNLQIDGELQADAAIVETVGKLKCPTSHIAGSANVLVFPNLESGNIAYKLVERLANAKVTGPILQGLASPVNDLSRGCSVEDIYKVIIVTANQATAAAMSNQSTSRFFNNTFATPLNLTL